MGSKTAFVRPLDLPLSLKRHWRIGYVLITPLLLVVSFLSLRDSLKSLQMLSSFQRALEHARTDSVFLGESWRVSKGKKSTAEAADLKTRLRIPPPLSEQYFVRRGTEFAKRQANHSWLQPLVFLGYSRSSRKPKRHTDLYLYMTGVSMGHFDRGFQVLGCVVGRDVYPVADSHMDVAMCKVPRAIPDGEKVSVALHIDDTLKRAMKGPVELTSGLSVKLNDGDVFALGNSVVSHIENITPKELMAVRSVAQAGRSIGGVKEDIEAGPRYEVCMVTQMKPYPYLLTDWINYHRRLGVDMVYVLDNGAPEDLEAKFSDRADVEVLFWPWERSQVQAVSWFLIAGRRSCEWILFTDADEYVMLGIGKDKRLAGKRVLKQLASAKRAEGYDQVFFPFVIMGSSGHVEIPRKAVPEAYIYMREDARNGKAMCRTDVEWFQMRVHRAKGFSRMKGKDHVKSYKERRNLFPKEPGDGGAVVHYQFRSWEEFALKMRTGSPSINDHHVNDGRELPEAPPEGYTQVDERLRYTHFRDIWRAVMTATGLQEQTIVRWRAGTRCAVVRRRKGRAEVFGEEKCEVV